MKHAGLNKLVPVPVDGQYITAKQLRKANAEAIRLGFSRTLKLPKIKGNPKFPVVTAFHHTSFEGFTNIRLLIIFATDRRGTDMAHLLFDVTDDVWQGLPRVDVAELSSR
jgi:hypothetical protein